MNPKQKESRLSDCFMMVVVVIIMIVAILLMGSGCGTVQGAASDIELVSGAVRKGLEPTMERRRQARVDRAAELVIAEKGNKDTNQ